ncbi:CL990 resistance protein [Variovorax sp. PBS-H4]|uniref:bleomycin resistance protein n=1 Tax=Variovorax sp. PBS-H4 TaxID=434008 RepID=UPI001317FA48|nr:bleomycin resistance protein [Variovorax sp. PBS-H4]VTU40327.1 CL990 resistance protein [Variovorax sp. PBS-H4]
MTDRATPNLPSRDFEATFQFYRQLGFEQSWRDDGWMILKLRQISLEFFPHPQLDPATSWFSCCLRLDNVESFFNNVVNVGVPEAKTGWPRVHRPMRESWGGLVGALIDIDGTLLRLVQE